MINLNNPSLNVLALIPHFCGLTETFIYNEVSGLSQSGVNLSIATYKRRFADRYPFEQCTVINERSLSERLFYLGLRKANLLNTRYSPTYQKSLRRILRSSNFDLVHCHFGDMGVIFLDNVPEFSKPVVISFHGFDASQKLNDPFYVSRLQDILSRPNVTVLTPSQDMLDRIQSYDIQVRSSRVIHYGANLDFFHPNGHTTSSSPEKVFLQVSSLREKKGHRYALEAFKAFKDLHPDHAFKFLIAGEGELQSEIVEQVNKLDLANYVEFLGSVNKDQVKTLLREADVFVHHSITGVNGDKEGIPNAIIEAMAMELPVLTTRHSGIPELVQHGVNGILVDERDVDALSKGIHEIYSWPKKTENRTKVLSSFNLTRRIETISNLYTDLANKE